MAGGKKGSHEPFFFAPRVKKNSFGFYSMMHSLSTPYPQLIHNGSWLPPSGR